MSDEESDDFFANLSREQAERRCLKEQILQDQVAELRNLVSSPESTRAIEFRRANLVYLEECNGMWDILPISKAIEYMHQNLPPCCSKDLEAVTDEERNEYIESLPFETDSEEWSFAVLILNNPFNRIYKSLNGREPLLQPDQGAKEALIENGIICGKCLKLSPKQRCSRCKIVNYCCRECQSGHWVDHKKQCRAERLKASDDYGRSTRKQWVRENGGAMTFVVEHPYPKLEDMPRMLGQMLPSFYTEAVHKRFETVYNKVGSNTYHIYGRELGTFLFQEGGISALRASECIISDVIQRYPLSSNNREEESGQRMIAEVLARRLLASSWDGIGSWMS